MKKTKVENSIIKAWKPLFDAYPEVKAIPVYAWGRYYKYEMAGNEFESYIDERGFSQFRHRIFDPEIIDKNMINWNLLKQIEEKHNIQGGEMWVGEWGDYLPVREDMVEIYGFDERGGMCLIIEKDDQGEFKVTTHDCDSPE